ncbi:MAG TPA: protein kinase, partial [Planctomycetota bacterium]|nr:protein kinase [Planctomycetota bacterium]
SPGGAAGFSPKPPPPLTRRFDPEQLKAAAKAGEAPKPAFGEARAPAFRMSAAEEQRPEQKFKERDGTALLGTANPTSPVELSRRALFGAKKDAAAEEKSYQPAPEFQPASDEGPAAELAGASSSKSLALDPSLRTETAEERLIRSELQASGLDVVARLGGSASTIVYRAKRRDLGQEVVVKAVRVQPGDPEGRSARLLSEGKIAARLHHPGIVQVHGVFRGRSFVAIVLESLHGISLADEVAARGSLTAREALVLGDRLARALIHAHGQGIVHRDVAPRNVMLTEQGELKLMGLGLATAADASDPLAGAAHGTPGFAAPEQLAGKGADRRADVYGLGATLYFALSGKAPAAGAGGEVTPISQVVPSVPGSLARIVARALRPNPTERFETCEAMIAALRDAAAAVSETGSFRKKGAMTALIAAASALEPDPGMTGPKPFGFSGRLVGREVVGLLRLIEAGKKTGWVEVQGSAPDGSQVVGAVHFRDGEFVRAAVQGRRSVVEALVEVALLPAVDFSVVFGPLDALGPTEERSPVSVTLQAVAER